MKLNSVLTRMPVFILLLTMLPGPTAIASDDAVPAAPITLQIEYWAVGDAEEHDDDGWLLAWKANASGDFAGEMRWWFPEAPPAPEGKYSHGTVGYYRAKWELWVDDELLLAGESTGKTVIPDGEDGIWDGHGIVIEANGDLSSLKGRKTYETGIVVMPSDPAVRSTGSGMFTIY